MKSNVKLVTRVDRKGNAVVYGANILAYEGTQGAKKSNILSCIKGDRKTHADYTWFDSSIDEINAFIRCYLFFFVSK